MNNIRLTVYNFQFDESHLSEITKEVNQVLGKKTFLDSIFLFH